METLRGRFVLLDVHTFTSGWDFDLEDDAAEIVLLVPFARLSAFERRLVTCLQQHHFRVYVVMGSAENDIMFEAIQSYQGRALLLEIRQDLSQTKRVKLKKCIQHWYRTFCQLAKKM